MKKSGLLNAPLSGLIASLGHGQGLCIGDAGLPVPAGTERIDLAVSTGVPEFLQVLDAVTFEMCVERAVLSLELKEQQPEMWAQLQKRLMTLGATVETVSHKDFKGLTNDCAAVVRTGECTPYSNVILYAGVTF